MLRTNSCIQIFRGATLEEEGSKGKPWKKQVTANEANVPQFLAPRVASERLRGAYVSLKLLLPKFSRHKLAEATSKDNPLMRRPCHNFGPSTPQPERCVAPMPRKNFCLRNFRGAALEDEGSDDKPWKKKVPKTSRERSRREDTPRTRLNKSKQHICFKVQDLVIKTLKSGSSNPSHQIQSAFERHSGSQ